MTENTPSFAKRVRAVLQEILALNRALEELLVDILAGLIPWLAPVIPAYLAWKNMTAVLGFNQYVAVAGAAVVEFLGIATINTVFVLWDYNDTRRKDDPSAPMGAAVLAAGLYITVILTVNVMLDGGPVLHRAAQALLSLLSVVGAITLTIRSRHARRLADIQAARDERKERRKDAGKAPEPSAEGQVLPENAFAQKKAPEATRKPSDWRHLSPEDRRQIVGMSDDAIMTDYLVSDRTAREWRKKARSNGHMPVAG